MIGNNNSQYIHETIVRDIVDIATDIKDAKVLDGIANRKASFRSAASASSALTLVFPVLISNSIGIQSAGIIAKAIERKSATMMQMLFSAFGIDDAKDAIDYIQKFHTNLDTSRGITVDSLIDALDKYVVQNAQESAMTAVERAHAISGNIAKKKAVEDDARNNLDYTLPSSVNENSLEIYKFKKGSNTPYIFTEDSSPAEDYKNRWAAKKNVSDYYKNQLIPSDVKKANELVPTMLTINFVSTANGEPIALSDIVIGIKAKLYPLDSLDIINRITIKNQDNNGFHKFIKATTREISFFKDFIFAIDRAKVDALSQSKRGSSSKLWKVLERRSSKSKIRRAFGMTNDASAISTLVISKEEVEYLKKTENINVEDPRVMRPIMEAYNLMGVVIVDEVQEIASFMFDSGDDMYEQVSFNNLEREANDGSSKKIINLMTKLAR